MKMALKGNTLILVEVDNVQFAIIKSWKIGRASCRERVLRLV